MDESTPYGFKWGPLTVTRIAHDDSIGYVLEVETDRHVAQVRVSAGGQNMTVTEPRRKKRRQKENPAVRYMQERERRGRRT